MTAKEYLLRVRRQQVRINQLELARREAWEAATATTAGIDTSTVGKSGVHRKIEAYGNFIDQIDQERARLAEIKSETIKTINMVPDNTLAGLLMAYYINGMTWEQTAVEIHYSYYRTVHDKHKQALMEIEKLLGKK